MNRYTFQSRPKELQDTDVRVTTEISKENTRSLEEILSLDPDTSKVFKEIKRTIYPICSSLPLLIYNLPEVVNVLLKNIYQCPSTVLKLLQALSRDVRQELSPYFPSILTAFIKLTENNQLLEEIFGCISILLKYLIKNLDIQEIFTIAKALISHKDAGIRHLASQSFSFLVRKDLKVLSDVCKDIGELAWELVKFSANEFYADIVLKASWSCPEAGRLAHLSLAHEKKYTKAVWESIYQSEQLSVLRDWCIMCNGNNFPKDLLQDAVALCKAKSDYITLTYILKYHSDFEFDLKYLLAQDTAFDCLLILTDYCDPHPETEVHEKLLLKAYKNKPGSLNFRECSQEIFETINKYILTDRVSQALNLLIYCFEYHSIDYKNLTNLNTFLGTSTDHNLVWLGLFISRKIQAQFVPVLKVSDPYILKEYSSFTRIVPKLEGEALWAAAEIYPTGVDCPLDLAYLVHPSLRVPAACLLQSSCSFMKIAWEIAKDPPCLENERHKIANFKRLDHFIGDSPRTACLFLIGTLWEKFSTLWKHSIISLSALGKKYPEVLWEELSKLLKNMPKDPEYPELYMKYSHIREWVSPEYVLKNLIEVIIQCPTVINDHVSQFSQNFLDFINEEYLKSAWIPTFPVESEYKEPKPIQKLILYIKVFTTAKSLEKVDNKALLHKIFIGLCADKNEKIRVLACEALINMKGEEYLIKDYLKALSKDESFKDTILETKGSLDCTVALCASRAFSKSSYCVSAYQYISSLSSSAFLLQLMPLSIDEDVEEVFRIPAYMSISFLRNIRNVLVYAYSVVNDTQKLACFLVNLYERARESSREITNKTISCINIVINKHLCSNELIQRLLDLLHPVFLTFSYDVRPKVIELLHSLVKNYPEFHAQLLNPCTSLLSNPKLDAKHAHKLIESLNQLPLPLTAELASSLSRVLSLIPLTPSLYALLSKLPHSSSLTILITKLLPLCIKNSDIKTLLEAWLPYSDPPPISELTALVLKNQIAVPLLGLCLPNPDGELLRNLGATRKKGLSVEICYDVQLEALQSVSGAVFLYPKTILYALSHFLISRDLGLRTTAGNAILGLVNVEGIEDMLSSCIKKSIDEEQIRSVLAVWNKLDTELSSPDPDRSTILNLGHLQIHRRARALSSLVNPPVNLLKKLIIPLITFYLLYSTSKPNYQSNFMHTLISTLGSLGSSLTWRSYYKLIKIYLKAIKIDENLSVKALASLLNNFPPTEVSAYQVLKSKVMPTLKIQLCDKKDPRRPKIRKFIAVALYKIISVQEKDERFVELQRLLMILSRQYKHKEESTKDSVLKTVTELLKAGCPQHTILKEFNHGLEPELFTHFLTKVLPTGLVAVTSDNLPVFHQFLLEYEQYSTYYSISKIISPELLPKLLASTKTLQHISQGLAENTQITPLDYISLSLSLLSSKPVPKDVDVPKYSQKDVTYSIQPCASNGTRPLSSVAQVLVSSEKVFGIRMLKLGIKKSKEIDTDLKIRCRDAAYDCLSIKKDEVVMGALEILRIIGDSSSISRIVSVCERAGDEIVIHSMKTLAALIKSQPKAETVASDVLPTVIYALQRPETQSSALKLLKVFIGFGVIDESIYDAMEEIPGILLSNPSLAAQICSLYSQFLIGYPLSDKRRKFHLDFLLKNIGCIGSFANNGILQALNLIIDKFPYEELKDYCDFMLLSLITAISNEEIESDKEKYLKIMMKIVKFNTSSPIILKIFDWILSENQSLKDGCIRFSIECLSSEALNKNILECEVLPKILLNGPSKLSLLFLVTWSSRFGGYEKEINDIISKLIESGEDLSENLVSSVKECSLELLESSLAAVQNNTFTRGIYGLLANASGVTASKKISAVSRKLFGRGVEDNRVLELLKSLLKIIRNGEYDRTSLLKTLLVFSNSINTEIKEVLQDIFKELHVGIDQQEFLTQYAHIKQRIQSKKESKKIKRKLMFVANPQLAAEIKQKKMKKSRLLKKNKLLKIAPYKRIKVESLIVKTQ